MHPVIVIGAARSGTRFLRGLLAAPASVRVVPHDIGYVWRHGCEQLGHDELLPRHLEPSRRRWIRRRVVALGRGPRPARASHLVEKSVPNSLRPSYVAAVLPEASIVHLVRPGRQVVESARRSWQAPRDLRIALGKLRSVPPRLLPVVAAETLGIGPDWARRSARTWGPRHAGIDDDLATGDLLTVCARQWARCVTTSLDQLARVEGPVHTIDFEALVSGPEAVRAVADALGYSRTARRAVVARWEAQVRPEARTRWRTGLDASDRDRIAAIVDPVDDRLARVVGAP